MSIGWEATEATGVLALAGVAPSLALAGVRPVVIFLAPLAGAVLCALAAMACIAIGGTVLAWFVGLAVFAFICAGLWWLRTRPTDSDGLGQHLQRRRPMGDTVVVVLGLLAVVGTAAWSLRTLGAPTVGFDARAIWLLHAGWYNEGHAGALAALRNPVLVISHAPYPPLISAAVAMSWRITGDSSDRLGVVVVALLNACAVAVAAWALVEAARKGTDRLVAGGLATWSTVLRGSGPVMAALAVLCAFGAMGPYASNGYADPLWAMAAVGVIAYALLAELSVRNLGVAVVLVAVAGLTKTEGTYVAMLLVVVVTTRVMLGQRGDQPIPGRWRRWRPVVGGVIALGALSIWPLMTKALHMSRDANTSGARIGSYLFRAHHTATAMAPYLHLGLLVVPLAVVGGLTLSPVRRRVGFGNDLWAWIAVVTGTALLAGAYVTGPGQVQLWLLTSVDRTSIFSVLGLWWILAFWGLVGVGALIGSGSGRPGATERSDRDGVETGAVEPALVSPGVGRSDGMDEDDPESRHV